MYCCRLCRSKTKQTNKQKAEKMLDPRSFRTETQKWPGQYYLDLFRSCKIHLELSCGESQLSDITHSNSLNGALNTEKALNKKQRTAWRGRTEDRSQAWTISRLRVQSPEASAFPRSPRYQEVWGPCSSSRPPWNRTQEKIWPNAAAKDCLNGGERTSGVCKTYSSWLSAFSSELFLKCAQSAREYYVLRLSNNI